MLHLQFSDSHISQLTSHPASCSCLCVGGCQHEEAAAKVRPAFVALYTRDLQPLSLIVLLSFTHLSGKWQWCVYIVPQCVCIHVCGAGSKPVCALGACILITALAENNLVCCFELCKVWLE